MGGGGGQQQIRVRREERSTTHPQVIIAISRACRSRVMQHGVFLIFINGIFSFQMWEYCGKPDLC